MIVKQSKIESTITKRRSEKTKESNKNETEQNQTQPIQNNLNQKEQIYLV